MGIRIIIHLLFVMAAATFGSALADDSKKLRSYLAPNSIMIYIHPTVTDRRFVEPLTCALEKVLTAPVIAQDSNFPISRELFANHDQIDASKIVDHFENISPALSGEVIFRVLIIANDLKDSPYNYVFSQTKFYGNHSTKVLSTARFESRKIGATDEEVQLLAQRLYKSILRSIVESAGHHEMFGCVMAFPNSVPAHDAKPPYLCPADHTILVEEGVLREREKNNCRDEIVKNQDPAQFSRARWRT